MRKTYKYRIYLTKGQRRILERQFEECRWLYNEILATRKQAYEESGVSLGVYDLQNAIPAWKKERPSLASVHSLVLQNVNIRVDLAFKAFFRRVKVGETPGFPRFKGQGRYDSITYSQYGNGVRLEGERLVLSKVGAVQVVLHRPLEGTPKTVTISRTHTGKWFAHFSVEIEPRLLEPVEESIGLDLGLASFATLSNGEEIENPRFYRRDEADLKRVQKRKDAAKQAADWAENAKQKAVRAKIHERIGNRRSAFAQQRSRELVDRYQVIVFEDLAPQEMGRSGGMRKSILDAAWGQFVRMTTDKAAEAGRILILVDPRNTSKMCSSCGELVQKTLSERTHACPHCGLTLGRDHNAALNILHRGLQHLRL